MFFFFCGVAQYVSQAKDPETYKGVEQFVRDQTDITTYTINGKPYDAGTIDKKLNQLLSSDQNYSTKHEDLITLYENSYATCENNVDGYLNWYYRSFFNDPLGVASQTLESLLNQDSYEDKQHTELRSRITSGVDLSKIESEAINYNQTIYNLQGQLCSNLENMHIYKIPDWLASDTKPFDSYLQSRYLDPSFGISLPEGNYSDREYYKDLIKTSIQDSKNDTLKKLQLGQ